MTLQKLLQTKQHLDSQAALINELVGMINDYRALTDAFSGALVPQKPVQETAQVPAAPSSSSDDGQASPPSSDE